MKVIDFYASGNVIRLYFGLDDEYEYWGDDWDDAPYEHNAGFVYKNYIYAIKDYAFSFDYKVLEAETDWVYNCNSPFSKEDMKNRKLPCLIIKEKKEDEYYWDYHFSKFLGSEQKDVLKIFFEDNDKEIDKKIKEFGGVLLKEKKDFEEIADEDSNL